MHCKKSGFFAIALWLLLSAAAGALELNPNHPDRYSVKKGDTLWDISAMFLQKPWRWPEIWHQNSQVRNPHRIYPGDELVLRYRDGKPVIEFADGSAEHGRDVKLSPGALSSAHDAHIPPIPLDAIWPFLSRPRVVGPVDLANAPYIVSSQDEHLISGSGNRIYVRGLPHDENVTRFSIFRCGEVYRRPVARRDGSVRGGMRPGSSQTFQSTCIGEISGKDILGYEALDVGDATIVKWGDPATAVIDRAQREVLTGDRLLPQVEASLPEFVPQAPEAPVSGTVLSVMDSLSQVGPFQVVVLDRGQEANLRPGHVLAAYQSGILVDDKVGAHLRPAAFGRNRTGNLVELPNERIAELMVFRVFEHISYALVVRAGRTVHVGDAVHNPD